MNLFSSISADLKSALIAKDEVRVGALRMLISAIRNKEIEERKKDVGLADEEIEQVIRQEVKKRKDAIVEYEQAGRAELSASEKSEMEVLMAYLPPEIDDESVVRVVQDSIRESQASGMGDFGKVMKLAMESLKGKASGDRVSATVKQLLNG